MRTEQQQSAAMAAAAAERAAATPSAGTFLRSGNDENGNLEQTESSSDGSTGGGGAEAMPGAPLRWNDTEVASTKQRRRQRKRREQQREKHARRRRASDERFDHHARRSAPTCPQPEPYRGAWGPAGSPRSSRVSMPDIPDCDNGSLESFSSDDDDTPVTHWGARIFLQAQRQQAAAAAKADGGGVSSSDSDVGGKGGGMRCEHGEIPSPHGAGDIHRWSKRHQQRTGATATSRSTTGKQNDIRASAAAISTKGAALEARAVRTVSMSAIPLVFVTCSLT